jgi:hypothetical protein
MTRTIVRSAALLGAVSLSLVATVAAATGAAADDAGPAPAAVVYVAPTPVDPQPAIAGHEGDVLMHVNVAMPAKAVRSVRAAAMKKAARG